MKMEPHIEKAFRDLIWLQTRLDNRITNGDNCPWDKVEPFDIALDVIGVPAESLEDGEDEYCRDWALWIYDKLAMDECAPNLCADVIIAIQSCDDTEWELLDDDFKNPERILAKFRVRDWWVYSTAVGDGVLMVECRTTGDLGIVRNPSKKEWSDAFYAPSKSYRWSDNSRVEITKVKNSAN